MTGSPRISSAEVLSIGTELLVGETRDTNSGEIVLALADRGVTVRRIQALPDDLDAVTGAFREAVARVDLVVSTGGLGPTPDDLTREAIAAAFDVEPEVDPTLERWLRGLWERRGLPFLEINRKQAWLIPSATAIPNDNGTAPGWWVQRPGSAIVIALPGPPREMRPMWAGWVLDRLTAAGLGIERDVRTLRLSGIGESQVADLLGVALLRSPNPIVATYARADAVDIRISAVDPPGGPANDPTGPSPSATDLAGEAEARVLAAVGQYVWARGDTTWPQAIEAALEARDWTLSIAEVGSSGSVTALLGGMKRLRHAELDQPIGTAPVAGRAISYRTAAALAAAVAAAHGTDVGIVVSARERRGDMLVTVGVATPVGTKAERRVAFLRGAQGRSRVALAAADVLLREIRPPDQGR